MGPAQILQVDFSSCLYAGKLLLLETFWCFLWHECILFVAAVDSSCSCVVLVYLCVLSVCWFRCGPYIQRSPTASSNVRRRDAWSELPCTILKMTKSLVRESKGYLTHLQCIQYNMYTEYMHGISRWPNVAKCEVYI